MGHPSPNGLSTVKLLFAAQGSAQGGMGDPGPSNTLPAGGPVAAKIISIAQDPLLTRPGSFGLPSWLDEEVLKN